MKIYLALVLALPISLFANEQSWSSTRQSLSHGALYSSLAAEYQHGRPIRNTQQIIGTWHVQAFANSPYAESLISGFVSDPFSSRYEALKFGLKMTQTHPETLLSWRLETSSTLSSEIKRGQLEILEMHNHISAATYARCKLIGRPAVTMICQRDFELLNTESSISRNYVRYVRSTTPGK